MKVLMKVFGILLTLTAAALMVAAFVDLVRGKESPALMVGMVILMGCIAALGVWLTIRGSRKASKTVADLQPGVSMNEALRRAATLMAARKFDETIAAYTAIAERHLTSRGVSYSQIGAAYYFKGRYEEALRHYELALQNGADEAMMADNIAEAQVALGRT